MCYTYQIVTLSWKPQYLEYFAFSYFYTNLSCPCKGWTLTHTRIHCIDTVYGAEISLTMPTGTLEDQFLNRSQNPFIG